MHPLDQRVQSDPRQPRERFRPGAHGPVHCLSERRRQARREGPEIGHVALEVLRAGDVAVEDAIGGVPLVGLGPRDVDVEVAELGIVERPFDHAVEPVGGIQPVDSL